MKLYAGQRLRLEDNSKYALIKDGFAEAYAVTKDDESYRQLFLAEVFAGESAYPAFDEFEQIEVMLYAVSDMEVELLPLEPSTLRRDLAQHWFSELVKLPWIEHMAMSGDDMVSMWLEGSVFSKARSVQEAFSIFEVHEGIISMLAGIGFEAEDKTLSAHMELRQKYQRKLIDNAIDKLRGETRPLEDSTSQGNEKIASTIFIVKTVAAFLHLSRENIDLAQEFASGKDQLWILRRLVQKGNMQMRFISLEKGWHKEDLGALIGYYGEKKELAAIIPVSAGTYRIVTSSLPKGVEVDEKEAEKVDSDAFACFAGLPQRSLTLWDLCKFVYGQIWREDAAVIAIMSILVGLIPLVTPIITETVFKDIVPIYDRQGLVFVTQVAIVTSFTMAALSVVRSIAVLRITGRADMTAEAALWVRLLSLPTKFFRRFTSGELAKRMMGLDAIKQVVNEQFISMVTNLLCSFWSILLMAYYSIKLTLVACLVWGLFSLLMAFVYRHGFNYRRWLTTAQNGTAGLVSQLFTGLAKFRTKGAEEQAYYLWSQKFGEQWKWNLSIRKQNNNSNILLEIEPLVLFLLVYCATYYFVKDGGISFESFLAFQAAFTSFNLTFNQAVRLIDPFCTIIPHVENLLPILEAEPEVSEDKVDSDVLTGAIEVRNLTFSYEPDGKNVVDDMSFKISAGENVAIVGGSGCGKSTLLRLLLGFEKPKSGAIYYDGQDLAALNITSVRSQMGVVLQNGQLMSGDLYMNIVGTGTLTMDDAWAAAEAAGIADDIRNMPMGMQTIISEGSSNISGGQRQRILIARALAARPAILIFDEATSALDNKTQAIVTESLNKLHTTRIVVAHRLSTIHDCDRIIVLDKGHIVESGTFDELAAKGGLFTNLVNRQIM